RPPRVARHRAHPADVPARFSDQTRPPSSLMALPPRNSSKPNKPDTTQPFKTALGAAVRAIGNKRELEVSFSADRPILTSDKARLANLPRLPTLRDIAIARGQGDAMAMRLASHDPETHRKRAPA